MIGVYGALSRGLSALTIDQQQASQDQENLDKVLRGYDMTQNVQIPCSGIAWREPTWAKFDIRWQVPFLNNIDRSRTDSDLDKPHFTTGAELQSDANVILTAQVRSWTTDPETGWLVGAQVRVCAWCPQARKKHPWTGVIHLSFTGYGAPSEDDTGA